MIAFTLFGLPVYSYGLAVALSAGVALLFAAHCARLASLSADVVCTFSVLALPLCVLGARAAYCLACWNWFIAQDADFFFSFQKGGFMLYGALLGGLVAAALTGRLTHQPALRIADALASPALLLIALCRLAEGLVGQGYGCLLDDWFHPDMGMSLFHPTDTSVFHFFPLAVQESYYHQWVFAVFVLEALLMLVLCVIVLRTRTTRPGWRAMRMIFLYACTQVLCESLRRDDVLRWGFVRVNQVVGGIVAAVCLLICCIVLRDKRSHVKTMVLSWLGLLSGAGLVLACEFAVEKKIVPLEWVPTDVVYLLMAMACLLMIASIHPLWRITDHQGSTTMKGNERS